MAEAQEAAEATVSRENEAVQYQFKLLAEHNDDTVIYNRGVGGFISDELLAVYDDIMKYVKEPYSKA